MLPESVRRHTVSRTAEATTHFRVAPVRRAVCDSLSYHSHRLPATACILRETHTRQVEITVFLIAVECSTCKQQRKTEK